MLLTIFKKERNMTIKKNCALVADIRNIILGCFWLYKSKFIAERTLISLPIFMNIRYFKKNIYNICIYICNYQTVNKNRHSWIHTCNFILQRNRYNFAFSFLKCCFQFSLFLMKCHVNLIFVLHETTLCVFTVVWWRKKSLKKSKS